MEALAWLETTPVAAALKASATLYLFVNAAHILAIGLIVGAILPLDLRLLGAAASVPLPAVGPFLSRVAALGIGLAVVTGLCLFSVRPAEYAGNPAFLAKLALLAAGVANAALLHLRREWREATGTGRVAPVLRLQALLSLLIWPSALLAGRWIGFI